MSMCLCKYRRIKYRETETYSMIYLTHTHTHTSHTVAMLLVQYVYNITSCVYTMEYYILMMTANTHRPKVKETADAMPMETKTLLRRLIFYFVRRFFRNSMNVLHTNIDFGIQIHANNLNNMYSNII